MVSSANMRILGFFCIMGIGKPLMVGLFLTLQASGSMARSNRVHERGSPCHTLRLTWKGALSTPFIATRVVACWYSDLIVLMKGCGKWKVSSIFHR